MTPTTSPSTAFSKDVLGRYTCNGLDEALRSTTQGGRGDARDFSAVVVGGGTFGSAFAQHLLLRDSARTRRVLVLEGGPFVIDEHTQNLPLLGLNPPAPTSIADLRAAGQDGQPRAEVWGLAWHSRDALFPGLAYCIGGRSLFWGGWAPQPLDGEVAQFPAAVKQDLQSTYFAEAAEQIGSSEVNDFIHGALHDAMRAQLFDGIQAGIVTEAVPWSELLLTVSLGMASAVAATAGSGATSGSTAVPDYWKLEAPLAVQSRTDRAGYFPSNKFSAAPLLVEAARQAYNESAGDDVRKRVMVVPNCHVTRLVTSGGRVIGVQTNQGYVPLAADGIAVIALGTIESTRLALLSFGGTANSSLIGKNLIAHLRTNMTIRIPREALSSLDATLQDLETSALLLKGRHAFADGTFGHYHLQITASALNASANNAEAQLWQKIPDIDTIAALSQSSHTHVVISLRGIGQMETRFTSQGVALDPETDEFGVNRAIVTLTATQKDNELFAAMEEASNQAAKIFGGIKGFELLGRNRDNLGTTHHEAGTLWMGDDPATSVTNSDVRFHAIENAYALGPCVCPETGSPNPMLTGIALSRRLADALTAPFVAEPGYVALFDGRSMANWSIAGQGNFLVNGGALEASPGGDLGLCWCTDTAPADFSLKLEWQRTSANDNSGVFVRFPNPNSKGYGNTAYVGVHFGFEVQIDENGIPDGAPMHRTGAIYGEPGQTFSLQTAKPVGEWNEYEIRVQGQTYSVFLNGTQVSQFINMNGSRGLASAPGAPSYIGLQSHTGRVAFRRIRIRAL